MLFTQKFKYMKTLFLKKPPLPALMKKAGYIAFALFVSAQSFTASNAQNFIPAGFPEMTYPAAATGFVRTTTHAYTYTMGGIDDMSPWAPVTPPPPYAPASGAGPLSDLLVTSWDDAPGSQPGFSYTNIASGGGMLAPIYDQGTVLYATSVRNIELSLVQDEMGYQWAFFGTNAPWYIVVSYYDANPGPPFFAPGHFMEVYKWNQAVPGGVILSTPKTRLSFVPNYTRISQDAHNTYGFCITWEDPVPGPTSGINFVMGFMNPTIPGGPSVSPPYTLAGTVGQTHPDVAMNHVAGGPPSNGLELQFLYYRLAFPNVIITESTIPFQMGPGWVVPPAPIIRDVNKVPYFSDVPPDLKTRIDAPDHWTDDWAYTYIVPSPGAVPSNKDIFVRYMSAGIANTKIVNNGSMANMACDVTPAGVAYLNDWPIPSFDQTTNLVNIEWYTQYQNNPPFPVFFAPNVGGYAGLQMDITTGGRTSGLDYLQVAWAPSSMWASLTPSIASSRQNDRTAFQYVVFTDQDPTLGPNNQMQNKERPWGAPTFKTPVHNNNIADLYSGTTAAGNIVKTDNNVTAYPNPFTDKVSLDISPTLLDKTLRVLVEDMSGKTVGTFEGTGRSVNESIAGLSAQLATGTYLIKIKSEQDNFNKVLKIQKLATH